MDRSAQLVGFLAVMLAFHAVAADVPEIPFTRYTLDNGLTLIVAPDHRAPLVAVNVWYRVGSGCEKPGRTGLAHLFEHLMFNGSAHFNDDYFKAIEQVGPTDLNGTTNEDRTNYFQTVPRDALGTVLWLESDRMGYLLETLDQARLDEQRGVVMNEKREHENQPYSLAWRLFTKNLWPVGHPYSWPVVGEMEDLKAITLEDARTWFKTWYGAANATLVIAGDVEPTNVLAQVKHYFGAIPAGPALTRAPVWIHRWPGTRSQRAEDRIPAPRIFKAWPVSPFGTRESTTLDVVSSLLSDGPSSRLTHRLVYQEKLATSVSAGLDDGTSAGTFFIQADAAPGVELPRLHAAIDSELARFFREGPTSNELARVQMKSLADFTRGLERIGGFGGKSDILARYSVFLNRPEGYRDYLNQIATLTPEEVRTTAAKWLSDSQYALDLVPRPAWHAAATDTVDRTTLPLPPFHPEARFPALTHFTLSNGLRVTAAPRPGVPLIEFRLLGALGTADDPAGAEGTASLACRVLTERTRHHSPEALSDALALLGANLSAGVGPDTATVSLSALQSKAAESLALFSEVLTEPAFDPIDFARCRDQQIASIRRAEASPMASAQRALPALLYGSKHRRGRPDQGTVESLKTLTPAALAAFHRRAFDCANAELLVTGDFTIPEMKDLLAKTTWPRSRSRTCLDNEMETSPFADTTATNAQPTIYLIDKPGAQQSTILAACLAPKLNLTNTVAESLANFVFGGAFTSRINLNLRESKHWSYGAHSTIEPVNSHQVFRLWTNVQSDKTADAIRELFGEIDRYLHSDPVTEKEFTQVRLSQSQKLASHWQTLGDVAGSLEMLARFKLPDDYYATLPSRYAAVQRADVAAAAQHLIHPARMVWIIVGDCAAIQAPLRALHLGHVQLLKMDGASAPNPADAKKTAIQ